MTTTEQPALFEEPERVGPRLDGDWRVSPAPGCWRYMLLGEEGTWLLIQGHGIRDGEILPLIAAVDAWAADECDDWATATRRVWGERLTMCPLHLAYVEECSECQVFHVGEGPLWRWTARADADDADRDRPGWFPVTVVDLEG
jgi:hypothetical protein